MRAARGNMCLQSAPFGPEWGAWSLMGLHETSCGRMVDETRGCMDPAWRPHRRPVGRMLDATSPPCAPWKPHGARSAPTRSKRFIRFFIASYFGMHSVPYVARHCQPRHPRSAGPYLPFSWALRCSIVPGDLTYVLPGFQKGAQALVLALLLF